MIPDADSKPQTSEAAANAAAEGEQRFPRRDWSPHGLNLGPSKLAPDWESHSYLALDFETTGLDAGRDRVVEVGAVRFHFDEAEKPCIPGPASAHRTGRRACASDPLQLTLFDAPPLPDGALSREAAAPGPALRARIHIDAALSSFVKAGISIPPAVTGITGIRDADVAFAPPFADVAPLILELSKGATILAHNAPFDLSFLYAELLRLHGESPSFAGNIKEDRERLSTLGLDSVIDTRLIAKQAFPELTSYKLIDLARVRGLDSGTSHRAFDDAKTCMDLFAESAGVMNAETGRNGMRGTSRAAARRPVLGPAAHTGPEGKGTLTLVAALLAVSVIISLTIFVPNARAEENGKNADSRGGTASTGQSTLPVAAVAQSSQSSDEELLRPDSIGKLSADEIQAAAKRLVWNSWNGGLSAGTALESILPSEALAALLASERDLDDFDEASQRDGPLGDTYAKISAVAPDLIHERHNYDILFAAMARELAAHGSTPKSQIVQKRGGRSPIAGPGDVARPSLTAIRKAHPYALDIFFTWFKKDPDGTQHGPALYSLSDGIVIGSSDDWQGGGGPAKYIGGGLSPNSGNGVIIYDPKGRKYYSYFHLSETAVSAGDLVAKGTLIGKGGNTGANARKSGHGGHVHVEIFDAVKTNL